jgi:hypothetical protein
MYSDIDETKFKTDIEVKKAIDLITWSIEGYGYRILEKIKNMQELKGFELDGMVREFNEYLEILKKCFYR